MPSGPRSSLGLWHPVKSNRARANLRDCQPQPGPRPLSLLALQWTLEGSRWRPGASTQCTARVYPALGFRCRKPELTSLLSARPCWSLAGAGGSGQRTGPATSLLGTDAELLAEVLESSHVQMSQKRRPAGFCTMSHGASMPTTGPGSCLKFCPDSCDWLFSGSVVRHAFGGHLSAKLPPGWSC